MKKKILSLALATIMTVAMSVNAFAAEETSKVYEITEAVTLDGTAGTSTKVNNPLKGIEAPEKIVIEYTDNCTNKLAAWQMVFGFGVEANNGFACFAYWPKIELNEHLDPNYYFAFKDNTILADDETNIVGQDVKYVYEITKESIKLTVNGEVQSMTLETDCAAFQNKDKEPYERLYNYLLNADYLYLGGATQAEGWWGEQKGEIKAFKISTVKTVADAPTTEAPTTEAPTTAGNAGGNNGGAGTGTPSTADASQVLPMVIVAAAALVLAVAMKKKEVTE